MPDAPGAWLVTTARSRMAEARAAYARALELVHDDAERRLLERRLAEVGGTPGG